MPMELWILVGLAAAAIAVGIVKRVSGSVRRERTKETKNIYPLW